MQRGCMQITEWIAMLFWTNWTLIAWIGSMTRCSAECESQSASKNGICGLQVASNFSVSIAKPFRPPVWKEFWMSLGGPFFYVLRRTIFAFILSTISTFLFLDGCAIAIFFQKLLLHINSYAKKLTGPYHLTPHHTWAISGFIWSNFVLWLTLLRES